MDLHEDTNSTNKTGETQQLTQARLTEEDKSPLSGAVSLTALQASVVFAFFSLSKHKAVQLWQ